MTMTKEDFISIIEDLQISHDYQIGLNRFFKKNNVDGYIFQPDCSCSVIKLLHMIFGEKDADEWIESFCFDFDFGRKYKDSIKTKAGHVVPFSTADDLYNMLTNNNN